MKVAQHPQTQRPVSAADTAPDRAVCPHCGGVLMLRRRRCMDGSFSYFWRHQDNRNQACNGRSHPVKR